MNSSSGKERSVGQSCELCVTLSYLPHSQLSAPLSQSVCYHIHGESVSLAITVIDIVVQMQCGNKLCYFMFKITVPNVICLINVN